MSDDNINKPDGESCDSTEPCSCSESTDKGSSGGGRGFKTILCVLILIAAGVVAANSVINRKPKECDTASDCCPSDTPVVVEQDNTPEPAADACGTEPCGTKP
ncbi:MAG: hypothetical protein DRP66_09920 [Planctomycetota bacterium]|nr:MAG: hypothetical protein DRP66_09920 [Planctomycetota bacterium]